MIVPFEKLEAEDDKEKVRRIYEAYKSLMLYVAYDILKDRHLAEDAVHQGFEKIIKNLRHIDDVTSHRTQSYVVNIVKCEAIDMYRKLKRQKVIYYEDKNVLEIQSHHSLIDELSSKEECLKILTAIDSLPFIYRQALQFQLYYDLSNAEIAAQFSISEAAVRQRLSRARAMLNHLLKEDRVQ